MFVSICSILSSGFTIVHSVEIKQESSLVGFSVKCVLIISTLLFKSSLSFNKVINKAKTTL